MKRGCVDAWVRGCVGAWTIGIDIFYTRNHTFDNIKFGKNDNGSYMAISKFKYKYMSHLIKRSTPKMSSSLKRILKAIVLAYPISKPKNQSAS